MSQNTTPEGLVDPNVNVPAAVRAAAARSAELHKQAYSQEEVQPAADPATAAAAADKPAEGQQEERRTPLLPPQARQAQQPKPQPPQGENWEHMYKSIKGRYDQQARDMELLTAQLRETQQHISALMMQQASAPQGSGVTFESRITPQEREEYGDELLGLVGKKAREEIDPEISALRQKIASLEQQLGGVSQVVVKTEQEKMFDHLDTSVPDWRTINKNGNFLRWLDLPDAYSGAIRKELLNAAFKANNGPRVAAFFKGFINDEAAVRPASQDNGNRAVTPPKPGLEQFAAPGRAKAAAVTPPAEKPIITRQQITDFYNDVRKGNYVGRDAEKLAFEQELMLAQVEGRVK